MRWCPDRSMRAPLSATSGSLLTFASRFHRVAVNNEKLGRGDEKSLESELFQYKDEHSFHRRGYSLGCSNTPQAVSPRKLKRALLDRIQTSCVLALFEIKNFRVSVGPRHGDATRFDRNGFHGILLRSRARRIQPTSVGLQSFIEWARRSLA